MPLILFLVSFVSANSLHWRERYAHHQDLFGLLQPIANCLSVKDEPIFYYEKKGSDQGKKILVLALMHGNELPSGEIAFRWIRRLSKLNPNNSWKIIPVMNPDGVRAVTRTNANGIDLNRHFPTKFWDDQATLAWKNSGAASQKFPGSAAATEPEVKCLMKLIDDYNPDLITSIHTPFNLLDFDGPETKRPRYLPMRWKRLGNYPGSLGRYAWAERNIPVLTIELPATLPEAMPLQMDRFQDELSFLAR